MTTYVRKIGYIEPYNQFYGDIGSVAWIDADQVDDTMGSGNCYIRMNERTATERKEGGFIELLDFDLGISKPWKLASIRVFTSNNFLELPERWNVIRSRGAVHPKG